MRSPVVFVTDYGRDDTYAAALVGAVLKVDMHARWVHGTHGVPPGDVLGGAYQLKALSCAFGPPVVFCAVVDPGVGTDRRAIAIDCDGTLCVAPDNGLASLLWVEASEATRRAVELPIPDDTSSTFHGRDVFAPAAAFLASGAKLGDIGRPIAAPLILDDAFAKDVGGALVGRVTAVDHFGNAITTVRMADLKGRTVAHATWPGGETSAVVKTYEDIGAGVAVLIGSAGHLEFASRGRRSIDAGGPRLHAAVTFLLA